MKGVFYELVRIRVKLERIFSISSPLGCGDDHQELAARRSKVHVRYLHNCVVVYTTVACMTAEERDAMYTELLLPTNHPEHSKYIS